MKKNAPIIVCFYLVLMLSITLHSENTMAEDEKGVDALIAAVEKNDLQKAQEVVKSGVNINLQGGNGMSALHTAARKNRVQIAEYLLQNWADKTILNNEGFTPFLVACAFGQDDIITLFLNNNEDPNYINAEGLSPLLLTSYYDYDTAVLLLLEKGSNPNMKNSHGEFPLLIAAQMNSIAVAKVLLEHGANVNLANNEGWTPLMLAVQYGYEKLVKIFVDHGADLQKQNAQGHTALSIAIGKDDYALSQYFVKRGAKPFENEDYPYQTAVSYYLNAIYNIDTLDSEHVKSYFRVASRYFEVAAKVYEDILTEKNDEKSMKVVNSSLIFLTSVALLSTIGVGTGPIIEDTSDIKKSIKINEKRLNQCNILKAHCDEIFACYNQNVEGKSPHCVREDLSLSLVERAANQFNISNQDYKELESPTNGKIFEVGKNFIKILLADETSPVTFNMSRPDLVPASWKPVAGDNVNAHFTKLPIRSKDTSPYIIEKLEKI